jgi:hypothetical protein
MKKNNFIIGGIALGVLVTGSIAVNKLSEKTSAYALQKLSVANDFQKPDGMKIWWGCPSH